MDASPIRRAVQLGLCLMLFAGLAVGCGGSKSSTQTAQLSLSLPSPSPKASASPMPSPTLDLNAFESDGGAFGTNGPALEDAGYTDRYPDLEGLDHMKEAYTIIVNGLPKAVDLNQVKTEAPGMISSDAYVNWQPMGRRDTVLPPVRQGRRCRRARLVHHPCPGRRARSGSPHRDAQPVSKPGVHLQARQRHGRRTAEPLLGEGRGANRVANRLSRPLLVHRPPGQRAAPVR